MLVALLEESRQLGFLGPGPVEDHIVRARAFASAVPEPPARALDLGAGGGLPGLVLALEVWPETRWTFLDAQAKRADFLNQAVQAGDLAGRVEVLTGRAEMFGRDPRHRGQYDLVTSRSFGRPAITSECASPFLAIGGLLVVSEPPDSDTADRWPATGAAQLGLGTAEPLTVVESEGESISAVTTDATPVTADGSDGSATGSIVTHLVRMRQDHPTPDQFPRRDGMPAKRPLF